MLHITPSLPAPVQQWEASWLHCCPAPPAFTQGMLHTRPPVLQRYYQDIDIAHLPWARQVQLLPDCARNPHSLPEPPARWQRQFGYAVMTFQAPKPPSLPTHAS